MRTVSCNRHHVAVMCKLRNGFCIVRSSILSVNSIHGSLPIWNLWNHLVFCSYLYPIVVQMMSYYWFMSSKFSPNIVHCACVEWVKKGLYDYMNKRHQYSCMCVFGSSSGCDSFFLQTRDDFLGQVDVPLNQIPVSFSLQENLSLHTLVWSSLKKTVIVIIASFLQKFDLSLLHIAM